jgi:hypothetical protein
MKYDLKCRFYVENRTKHIAKAVIATKVVTATDTICKDAPTPIHCVGTESERGDGDEPCT